MEFARLLLDNQNKYLIYNKLKAQIPAFLHSINITSSEIKSFDRLLAEDIGNRSQSEIFSTGYVLHSLEASIWCLLTTDCYRDAVLAAVNLGNDTDTTAAITGGLAGILYGSDSIPSSWLNMLARRADIEDLAVRLGQRLG